MLVLTRKESEVIVIDGKIKIYLLSISGNVVKVGVEAPQEIKVKRGELK